MLRSKDLAQRADDEIIQTADLFVVNWFIGRSKETYDPQYRQPLRREDLWIWKEFPTLEEALEARRAAGPDPYGRWGAIYAANTQRDISVFVDDAYIERTKPKLLTRPTRRDI
jgi:hypothetical protein